ncbi:MAG: hypothetical protein NC483_06755 [Ruminococcus sp.]|nr:hypothetical protein [Ruminococcus sp.]
MKVIGIDIDDTITKTSEVGNKYLAKYNSNYHDYHELSQEQYRDFVNLYLKDIVENNILKEDVVESFKALKEMGYEIVIITARSDIYTPGVKAASKEFLNKNNIKYDKLVFDDLDLKDKRKYALENNVEIFIDDKEEVLDSLASVGIECIRITEDKTSKYKTFSNWRDIIEYIKRREC